MNSSYPQPLSAPTGLASSWRPVGHVGPSSCAPDHSTLASSPGLCSAQTDSLADFAAWIAPKKASHISKRVLSLPSWFLSMSDARGHAGVSRLGKQLVSLGKDIKARESLLPNHTCKPVDVVLTWQAQ